MAVFSTSELNATIDERWDMEVEDFRYAKGLMLPLVSNKTALIKAHGDIVNLTIKKRLTTVDVTSGTGAFVSQNYTPDSIAINIDQWKAAPIETVDNAQAQSFWRPESDFPKDAALALNEDYDNSLLDLDTNLTSNFVNDPDSPTTFDEVAMLAALLKLADRNIPKESLVFILPPIAFYKGIATKPSFVDANKTGMPKSLLLTAFRFKLANVPAFETTLINKAGASDISRTGLLLHKSAFAIAVQRRNEVRRADAVSAGRLSRIIVMHTMWGVKTFREDHGCRIHISAT